MTESQAHPAAPFAPGPMAVDEPTVRHVPVRRRRRAAPPRMSINLGPMIDVIFNLLIYFVVTASFAVEEGVLTLKLPQGSGTPEQSLAPPPQPLNIVIRPVGPTGVVIALQDHALGSSFEQLYQQLASLQFSEQNPTGSYRPDDPILIRPEGEVRWQHVVNAFNAALRAQYRNVSFAQPEPHAASPAAPPPANVEGLEILP